MVEPAGGIGGDAFGRPALGRRDQRFLNRVLRRGEVAVTPGDGAEHLRREVAQQVPDVGACGLRHHASTGTLIITWRTSIGMFSGLPPGPGAAEAWAAIS